MHYSQLKAVTFTHVRYNRGDQLGHFLAWISLLPVFTGLVGSISHFLFRRELQGMLFFLGLLISQLINEVIKRSVQQARPETCALLEACDSHGWPSSHSQYMFFFATYFTLMTCKGIGFRFGLRNRWIVNLLNWSLAVLTMVYRVYLGYHTVAQVFAGATVGAMLGSTWFWFVNSAVHPYFPAIEESAIGRTFCIKDTSHIPDVLKFEYDNARAARKKMASNSKTD
ncbi:PREDICTED: lipid phosphate phosphatase gamma, chloroplastic [Tarenaya hassleriana]|uniref:lipid phosphate phosphatase gamma, chloroplastic n=1 Tax=Tarenaya hassleriana TaxID=28532 RepID=UPI00053CA249|nr:PREDICTED: lipid phosphate phosphatase gamma, chloroplastic [Tarenaya hassleriana]